MRRSLPSFALGGTYVVGLALVGMWPQSVDEGVDVAGFGPVHWMTSALGFTGVEGYDVVQFTANVVLFAPLGVLAWWVRRRTTVVQAALIGAGVSTLIEVLQHVLRPERVASAQDVVANTLGAAIGAAAMVWWARRSRA